MKRIGIFGGSFDPPHCSHKAIIDECIKRKLVDEVWVMPSCNHPHKSNQASFEQRIKMCKMMFTRWLYPVRVENFERCNASGTTLNLLRILREFMPEVEFKFIIGRDCADNIQSWYKPNELIHQVPFIVFERNDYAHKGLDTWYIVKPHCLVSVNGCSTSSTVVRNLVKDNHHRLVRVFTNKKVARYIQKEKLYENIGN